MPNTDKLRNRYRVKRTILSGVLLTFLLLLLLAFVPARMLGWSGLAFLSLSEPAPAVAAVDEPVAMAMAVATVRTPPLIEPLTFPAYAEWSDLETACDDCDWSVRYGVGGDLDAVDSDALSRLEQASGFGARAGADSVYRTASTHAGSSSGGGMGGGGAAAGYIAAAGPAGSSAAAAGGSSTAQATEGTSEFASDDPATTTASVATAAKSSGGFAAADVADAAAAASSTPDLILSRAMPGGDGLAGPSSAGALPQEVVKALVESPVGSETVHSAGEPEVISAALDLDETPAAAGGDVGAQQQTVPEPMSLLLVGLGISAGILRQRRAAVR